MLLRVDRDVTEPDGTFISSDTRYFLTSLDPGSVTADELLHGVRAHWQVENSCFFLKDRWWDEDRHWTRRPGVADWYAQLTSIATSVLRLLCSTDLPLRATADEIQWHPQIGLELLGLR